MLIKTSPFCGYNIWVIMWGLLMKPPIIIQNLIGILCYFLLQSDQYFKIMITALVYIAVIFCMPTYILVVLFVVADRINN